MHIVTVEAHRRVPPDTSVKVRGLVRSSYKAEFYIYDLKFIPVSHVPPARVTISSFV